MTNIQSPDLSAKRPLPIVHVSDTHLSRSHAYFVDNWQVFCEIIASDPPDLVIHSGDVSFNGPANEDDLAFARLQMDRLPCPWLSVPGNHDIGEAPRYSRLAQPLNDERIAAWNRHFGQQFWLHDIGDWRIVGVDTALMASDRPEEVDQRAFLCEALETRGERPVLLMMHMPPFVESADEAKASTSSVVPEARAAFLETCRTGGVKAIACGHLHIHHQKEWGGMEIVWGPCTSFVKMAQWYGKLGKFPRSGYVEWRLEGDRFSHSLVQPVRMISHDMGLWSEAHGSTTKLPPRPLV
jgi:3',5'-cyclic AMP phosphodiesterase CpdA